MSMADPTDGTAYTGAVEQVVVTFNRTRQTISITTDPSAPVDTSDRVYYDVTPASQMPIPAGNKNIKKGRSSGKRKRDTNPRTKGQW